MKALVLTALSLMCSTTFAAEQLNCVVVSNKANVMQKVYDSMQGDIEGLPYNGDIKGLKAGDPLQLEVLKAEADKMEIRLTYRIKENSEAGIVDSLKKVDMQFSKVSSFSHSGSDWKAFNLNRKDLPVVGKISISNSVLSGSIDNLEVGKFFSEDHTALDARSEKLKFKCSQ